MDWQTIILTLGASFITGAVSLIGNVIISKSNLRRVFLDNEIQAKKEFIAKRNKTYDKILQDLFDLEINCKQSENFDLFNDTLFIKNWLENCHYCSRKVNNKIQWFIKYFKAKDEYFIHSNLEEIRKEIKIDLDDFYGVKDKKENKRG